MNRSEYLSPSPGTDREVHHRAYYAQFVTPAHFFRLKHRIGVDRIKRSEDPHFNDIPLKTWDLMAEPVPAESVKRLRDCGDCPTLAGAVCILKEAARQVREGSVNV